MCRRSQRDAEPGDACNEPAEPAHAERDGEYEATVLARVIVGGVVSEVLVADQVGAATFFLSSGDIGRIHRETNGASTESGAYLLSGATNGLNYFAQPGAKFRLPTEDECTGSANGSNDGTSCP